MYENIKHFMWITFKFSQLWFIFCLRQPKSKKNTFQATKFKVEENSSNFQRLAQTFKDFSKKNGIQGLFKDFPNWAPVPWKLIYWSWVQWSLKVPWGVSLAMTYLVKPTSQVPRILTKKFPANFVDSIWEMT